MDTETPIIERALQIAREGRCANTMAVRLQLSREGYSGRDLMHITPSVSLQIRKLCGEAQAKRQP